ARDVFEEGIKNVMTVRDFTQIFDTYAQPFLVNDVLLRQNPNNVHEWEKRVSLWKDNKEQIVETYNKAILTINPKKATGKLHELWVNFAKFYEENGDIESARIIFEKGTHVDFKNVNDLATLWCEYAEMELRNENYDKAIEVMGHATIPPRNPNVDFRDESIGTIVSTRAVYDRMLELKIATPQIVINYAAFLEENNYFEESYKIYERGIELFNYPIAFEIWNLYLTKFVARYKGSKLERARDLFEQALEKCPPKHAKTLYLMYGKLEEDYGLARHAMRIYDRATNAVADEDPSSNFGITYTRELYERAIEVLPDREAKDMCLKYAEVECKLGEIDRARAIYAHASQFCDPRTVPSFWQLWHDFEVKHGNEDTFKEMLRIKRSVQAQYNTEVNFISAQILATRQAHQNTKDKPSNTEADDHSTTTLDPMKLAEKEALLESNFTRAVAFVSSSTTLEDDESISKQLANPDEITMDDDDDL
ncbi:15132_t:CDS:10, partial [Entrophospora sp. SA101]